MSRCCRVFLSLALLLDDLNIGRVVFCCFLCHIGLQCGGVIVNLARFRTTGRERRKKIGSGSIRNRCGGSCSWHLALA